MGDWRDKLGVVYSTDPDFEYKTEAREDVAPLAPERQNLRIGFERKHRGGKQVTLVTGFVGPDDALAELAKMLKTRLGVGGAAKDGEIIIQGDVRGKVAELLHKQGYIKTKV